MCLSVCRKEISYTLTPTPTPIPISRHNTTIHLARWHATYPSFPDQLTDSVGRHGDTVLRHTTNIQGRAKKFELLNLTHRALPIQNSGIITTTNRLLDYISCMTIDFY